MGLHYCHATKQATKGMHKVVLLYGSAAIRIARKYSGQASKMFTIHTLVAKPDLRHDSSLRHFTLTLGVNETVSQ